LLASFSTPEVTAVVVSEFSLAVFVSLLPQETRLKIEMIKRAENRFLNDFFKCMMIMVLALWMN
jgi:hypothetical protein